MTTDSRLPADLTTRLSQLASPALPRPTRPGTWRQILLKPDILSGDRLCIGVLYQSPPHPAPYFRLVDPGDYLQLATLYNTAMLDNLRYVHRLVETALTHGDLILSASICCKATRSWPCRAVPCLMPTRCGCNNRC